MKSLWAVVAGVVVTVVVTGVVDVVLHLTHFFPGLGEPLNDTQSLVATVYRFVITVAAAWLTAWLAPSKPMKHALILGVVGTLLGLIGVAATWNANLGPRWYPIALTVLAMPQCWLGGWLFEQRAKKAS
jgi:hypothetical protein